MVKSLLKGSIVSVGLASALLGSQITIQQGWNLLGTGFENVDLSNTFSTHPGVSLVWGYTNDTKKWLAYGNSAVTQQLLTEHNVSKLEFVPAHVGYWVLNNGTAFTINTPDSNGTYTDQNNTSFTSQKNININVTYGAALTGQTLSTYLVDGTTFFEIGNSWYSKSSVSNSSITIQEYSDVNGSLVPINTETINFLPDSSYTFPATGEEGILSLESVNPIETVNGSSVSGIVSLKVSTTITKQGTTQSWSTSGWTPTYWDDTNKTNVKITDIDTFKNLYIKPNYGQWFGDYDNPMMFAASSDTTVTSGDIVSAEVNGTQQNCTESNQNDCNIYVRSSTKVGTWDLTNEVLTADTNTTLQSWRFNSGILQESWNDKVGTKHQMEWITGGTDATVNSAIESTILSNYK